MPHKTSKCSRFNAFLEHGFPIDNNSAKRASRKATKIHTFTQKENNKYNKNNGICIPVN